MTKKPATKRVARQSAAPSDETATQTASDARTAPDEDFLAMLWDGLDGAFQQASERVSVLEAELGIARRKLAAVEAIKRLRDGDDQPGGRVVRKSVAGASGGTGSGPRGAVPVAVTRLLQEAGPDGLTRAEILKKLQITDDDKSGQQSVSNFLSSSKRNGRTTHHDDGRYSLNA